MTTNGEAVVPRHDRAPLLVFWETTRACLLACAHCRAEAQRQGLPGELTTTEAVDLLAEIRLMGDPPPVLVLTGGDPLMRPDLADIVSEAVRIGLHVALSPAATPLLTGGAMAGLAEAGVGSMSLSIDAIGEAHDAIRGIPGTFGRTLDALRLGRDLGLRMQVNTVVMRRTVAHLPRLAAMLLEERIPVWEVFFLVPTGRAQTAEALAPEAYADVCRFLVETSRHGLLVRPVEGPLVRRILDDGRAPGPLFRDLVATLESLAPDPPGPVRIGRQGTLDGDGIIFVGYDGTIRPGGLLPVPLGNVRRVRLTDIYRDHPLLSAIRRRDLPGQCGSCAWSQACGGSRARAFAATGDPLGDDPSCPYLVRHDPPA